MFKLALSPSYFWPVTFQLPTDGGVHEEHTFEARFKRMGETELEALVKDIREKGLSDLQVAERILEGWRGVQAPDGSDLPVTAAAKHALLRVQGLPTAVVMAFFDSLGKARQKN